MSHTSTRPKKTSMYTGIGCLIVSIAAGIIACTFHLTTWTGPIGTPLRLLDDINALTVLILIVLFVLPASGTLVALIYKKPLTPAILAATSALLLLIGTLTLADVVTSGVLMWDGQAPDGRPIGGTETTRPATGYFALVCASILQLAATVFLLVQVRVERNARGARKGLDDTGLGVSAQ